MAKLVGKPLRIAKSKTYWIIDDTTAIPVRPSYDSWRYKGYNDEAEEDSKSDGEDDEDESDRGKVSTTESVSEVVSGPEYEDPSQSLGDDTKKGYANYVHNARFSSQRQNGTDSQSSFQRVNDIPNPNHPPYSSQMASMARTYQQPNLMLQEPFRRHSDSSERFSSSGPLLSNFLPNANIAHIANLQFQTIQPSFQLPATSISPSGPVLPSPLSVPIARPLADVPHFPAFHDTSLFPRSNAAFQATVRDPIFGSHGNLQQLPQQQQNFQDYLHSQHYGHDAPKMHILNLNNETRSEFKYDQENASNVPRSKFAYEVKPQCSLEPATFDLDEIENGGSNGHS
jgi:hypothetical protein